MPQVTPSQVEFTPSTAAAMNKSSVAQKAPTRKYMDVRIGHTMRHRRLTWYEPCEPQTLQAALLTLCGLPPSQPYLLLDDTMSAVCVTASLPSGGQFELVPLGLSPGVDDRHPAAVVVVDPISTGAILARRAHDLGFAVVRVWSDVVPEELRNFVDPRASFEYAATIQHTTDNVPGTVSLLRDLELHIRDVMVGCETGVLLGDALCEGLGVRGNGTAKSALRRNKFLQTEALRLAGINACGQRLADSAADVEDFIREREESVDESRPFEAVVKPVEGAGSDGVTVCHSADEVRRAFASLEGTKNVLGLMNYSVLLQEYLRGDEYVIDTVSRSGVHKCVAIWKYDKRMCNGSPLVYFGLTLMHIDSEPGLRSMVEYTFRVRPNPRRRPEQRLSSASLGPARTWIPARASAPPLLCPSQGARCARHTGGRRPFGGQDGG